MAAMLAIIPKAEEAALAAAAGADRVVLLTDGRVLDQVSQTALQGKPAIGLMAAEGADPADFARAALWPADSFAVLPLDPAWTTAAQVARARGATTIGVVSPSRPLDAGLVEKAAAWGFAGLHVGERPYAGERLLDRRSSAELQAWAVCCRAHRLSVGFSGALEVADVPRLSALRPDHLGFDVALRDGAGRFDPNRVRAMLNLMSSSAPSTGPAAFGSTVPDRIFVRDWTVTMSIGAYAHERGKPQRVRCSVEAGIRRSTVPTAGMATVVSYDLITDAIGRLAAEHIDLVETFAERLASAVLAHPRVASVDITVEKLDVGPGSVGCRLVRSS